MESTKTWAASSLLASSVALIAACGSSEGPVLSGAGPGGDDAGPVFEPGSDAGGGAAFDAYVEQNQVAVTFVTLSCSGDCAAVQAVGTGGHPPYTFEWDDGSTTAARRVCPTSSTKYSVKVTDTGTSGEFARAPETVQRSVTADVVACPDGGGAEGAPLPADACVGGIENPSFEGTPQHNNLFPWDAPGWQKCSGDPAEITETAGASITPTDGDTFVYILPSSSVPAGPGGLGQTLCSPISGGTSLSFTLDAVEYSGGSAATDTEFQIFGGDAPGKGPHGIDDGDVPFSRTAREETAARNRTSRRLCSS